MGAVSWGRLKLDCCVLKGYVTLVAIPVGTFPLNQVKASFRRVSDAYPMLQQLHVNLMLLTYIYIHI